MAQLLVRELSSDIVSALKRRAQANGRSAEAEHRAILKQTLAPEGENDFWEMARRSREATRGRITIGSEHVIREDRDRDG